MRIGTFSIMCHLSLSLQKKGTESWCTSTSTWMLLLFNLFISKMYFSFQNVLQNIICVMLFTKFLFYKWWVPEQTGASSGALWFDVGLTVCSFTIIFTSLALTVRATLRSNRAIKPLTSMLCQESGLTKRFSLFGRSSSEPEQLPPCHFDTAVFLWGHICKGHSVHMPRYLSD